MTFAEIFKEYSNIYIEFTLRLIQTQRIYVKLHNALIHKHPNLNYDEQ